MKYGEEIISKFLKYTEKERTLEQVCRYLNMNDLDVMGLVYYLKQNGNNIATKNSNGIISMINKGDVLYPPNMVHQFFSDDTNEFKFIVIADTRLGSKYQQLNILNNIYAKGYEEGYRHVFLVGNISAGVYSLKDDRSEMNFINDSDDSIDYIVKYYPYVEGMETYIVTGPLDVKCKKVNIGQRIADVREDINYLGTKSAIIKIDNDKVKLMTNVLSKPYTMSKRLQDHIMSERSEDKPRMLFSGGLCQMESAYIRNVYGFSVPSICATTKEMGEKRYSNTIGAIFINAKINKKGYITSCTWDWITNFQSLENDYLKAKQLRIEEKPKQLMKKKAGVINE